MQSYPFTSQVTYDDQGLPLYDRAVDSAFLRKVFAAYFSDGIFYKPTNALQVVAGGGMQVQVNPGICHIQGAMGIQTDTASLALSPAAGQPRIDTVVARLDLSQAVRSVELYVKPGTAAASPARPALTRDSTIWELGLADIEVGANVGNISQANITDTRLDTARCGMVAQTIGSLDTAPYFAQLQQAIAEHQDEAEAQIAALQAAIAAVEGDTAWMLKAVYDAEGQNRDVFQAMGHLYKATLLADNWTSSGSGKYTQTAALAPMTGGPAVTAGSVLTSAVMCEQTDVEATNETLQDVLAVINAGNAMLGANQVTVTVFETPEADIEAIWQIKQGVS
uniref:Receptor Binding Protein n=1 Tax=Myoviridae sp. ctool15 TaxID=2826696 RepID=A0A8S5QYJ1_9CAUD|nr:MAG TPA: Receptor Binding Protein [Myoviridae sp. ctool15]